METYHVVEDRDMNPGLPYRIVTQSAIDSRLRMNSSARPDYVAVVANLELARRIVGLLNCYERELELRFRGEGT